MCRQVLGIKSRAWAIALTPIGSFTLPNNRKIAIARETAGTARVRTVACPGVVPGERFIVNLVICIIIIILLY
jgi:hypothetical protein